MKRTLYLAAFLAAGTLTASAATFHNALSPSENTNTMNDWLADAGIVSPEFLVDFESFSNNTNVHDASGLFPLDLVFRDTSGESSALVNTGPFAGSNPIGELALEHNEQAWLELDFGSQPVSYVAGYDIDQAGGIVRVTLLDGAVETFTLDTTAAAFDSAEFWGLVAGTGNYIQKVEFDVSGDSSWALDNVMYGGAVPEPATMLALGAGLALIARRRQSK